MMKKLTASALAVLLTLASCIWAGGRQVYAESDEAGIAGVWKLSSMKNGEDTAGQEEIGQLEQMGMLMYMVISEDGTLTVSAFGAESEGTWDDTTITAEDAPLSYELDGDALTLHDGTDFMVFSRTTLETVYDILGYQEGILDESVTYLDEDQVLMDTESAAVTITGYHAASDGFRIQVRCENRTENTVLFGTKTAYVNRFILDPVWAQEVGPGESVDSEMVFSVKDLGKCGISSVDELILVLQAMDSENWEYLTDGEAVTVYPTGKNPEEITAGVHVPEEGEQTVADNEYCRFSVLKAENEPLLGYMVSCYVENKTDRPLTFEWSQTSVNGTDVTAYYAEETLPGTRGFAEALIPSGTLEEAGIVPEDITEISFTLTAYDTSGDTPETVMEETITCSV